MTKPLTREMFERIARLPKSQQKGAFARLGRLEWEKCANDIFYWLDPTQHVIPYVYTVDSKPLHECTLCGAGHTVYLDKRDYHLKHTHSIVTNGELETSVYFRILPTVRPFPIDLPYVRPIVEQWLKNRFFLVEKSRDMLATWTMVMCHTWEAAFHPGREILFQSEIGSKTKDLVERAYRIWKYQPKWLRDVHPGKFAAGQNRCGELSFPTLDTKILGLAQGAEQIRQYHPTAFFVDEAAYHPDAEDCFIAVKPALNAGGRYTAVSSANPGFFMRLCRDLV